MLVLIDVIKRKNIFKFFKDLSVKVHRPGFKPVNSSDGADPDTHFSTVPVTDLEMHQLNSDDTSFYKHSITKSAMLNKQEKMSDYRTAIGYNAKRMGTSRLRETFFTELFADKKDHIGASSVHLTVDASIQARLYALLNGSVVSISVINARTREIIAITSRGAPEIGFNVNLIDGVYEGSENDILFYSELYNSIKEFWLGIPRDQRKNDHNRMPGGKQKKQI